MRRYAIRGEVGAENESPADTARSDIFFSSRRRHTRFDCDWSSDVCSSDLKASSNRILEQTMKADYIVTSTQFTGFSQDVADQLRKESAFSAVSEFRQGLFEIGRASCRERG